MDENSLLELAGSAAYERGLDYFRNGRVGLSERHDDGFEARAEGTACYRLWLRVDGGDLNWACSCPAAADGSFCKHLVAGALAWLGGAETGRPEPAEDELLTALRQQPPERLADWLYQAALDDPALERSLRLRLSGNAGELKKALGAMLRKRGFLDWRRSMDFARQLQTPLGLLTDLLKHDPPLCLELAEYALTRLLRIYAEADDSAGSIGDAMGEFAELHARAAAAAPVTPRKLADRLYKLKRQDDWELFRLTDYWDALGAEGQRRYVERVEAEFAALPETAATIRDVAAWSAEAPVASRYEELARVRGDFESLLRVLSRDLGSGHAYQRIVAACHDHGHDDLALDWAQRGLAAHPDWPGMRVLAATELERAGRLDEARALLWADFRQRPDGEAWLRLRRACGDDWPGVREQALTKGAERERRLDDGLRDVTLRLELLRLDDDLDTARRLALKHHASPGELEALAGALAEAHPGDASRLIRRAVDAELAGANARSYHVFIPRMSRAVELDPGESAQWLSRVRERYRARRKLMGLMDEAGL